MRIRRLAAALAVLGGAMATAPGAAASADSFCGELGGAWDGQYCRTVVESDRRATREISVAIPWEFIDDPAAGPVVRDYLTTLVNNWRKAGVGMAADSFGEGNYQAFRRGDVASLAYHETYHADGPDFNNAYRTFTFDTKTGKRLQLSDLVNPGTDALGTIASLGEPFIRTALDQARPPHAAGSYPFIVDRWTPNNVYSGGYRAWALTPGELILYMPDYPVGRDSPINFTPGIMQWPMDGGTVEAHIPLAALNPVLRPEFQG